MNDFNLGTFDRLLPICHCIESRLGSWDSIMMFVDDGAGTCKGSRWTLELPKDRTLYAHCNRVPGAWRLHKRGVRLFSSS